MAPILDHARTLSLLSLLVVLQAEQVFTQPQMTIQSGHRGMIRCLALSMDEKYLASAGADKTIIVWDVDTEKRVLTFSGHENWILALEFNKRSARKLLASGDYDGTVKIWDLETSQLDQEITDTRPYSITSLAFDPTGEILAIATGGKISLWDTKTRTMKLVLEGHRGPVTKLIFGRGNYLFSSSLDGTLRMWNVITREETLTKPEEYGFAGMTADPDKRLFAMAYSSGKIKILDLPRQQQVELEPNFPKWDFDESIDFRQYRLGRFVKTRLSPNAMVFLPDGKLAYNDGFKIRIWDHLTTVSQPLVDIVSGNGSTSLVFSKKRNSIFYDDGADVKTIALDSTKSRAFGNNFQADFGLLALDSNGVLLAGGLAQALIMTTQRRSTLFEYQAESLAPLIAEFPVEFEHGTRLVGQWMRVEVSGSSLFFKRESNKNNSPKEPDKTVAVLTAPGKIEKCWTDHENTLILCSTEGAKSILWSVKTRRSIRTFAGKIETARFSHDRTYIGIADGETLKIWSLKDRTAQPTTIKTEVERLLVFSPDNKFVAAEVLGGTIADIVETDDNETDIEKFWGDAVETLNRRPRILKIWDRKSGSPLHQLPMQTTRKIDYAAFSSTKVTLDPIILSLFGFARPYLAPSGSVSFSNDGDLVVYDELDLLSGNSRIKVWDLRTNREVCVFEGHTSSIRRIIFSPDNKLVLSSGWDSTLKIWNIAAKELKATIVTSKEGWLIFTPKGRFDTNLNLRKMDQITWNWPQNGIKPLPLRIFLRDYYEPGLFRKILGDDPLKEVRDLTSLNVTQPKVTIRAVESDGPDSVRVTVDVNDVPSDVQRDANGRFLHSGVFDVRLFRNDQLVAQSTSEASINEFLNYTKPSESAPDRLERELETWRRTHRVELNADGKATLTFEHIKLPKSADKKEIDLTAYAFNSDRVTSELSPAFKYGLPALSSKAKPKAYIVTIGVDANQSGLNLSFAAGSANEVQKLIAGKVGKTYDVVKVSLLSTFRPNSFRHALTMARKENVRAVLGMLAGRVVEPQLRQQLDSVNEIKAAGPDDLVFIYIASHGFSDRYGNFSMIPYNSGYFNSRVLESTVSDCLAGKGTDPACKDSREFIANSISSTELTAWLQGVDAGKIYMILDSCYSAAAPGSNFKPGPLGDRTFGQLGYDKLMTILTASQKSAFSSLKLNSTLLSKTLLQVANKNPNADLLYLLQETEFRVPLSYRALFPHENKRIQFPVLFDFSENEN